MHWRSKFGAVFDEAEVKNKAAQEKYDGLHARYLELEEKFEIAKEAADVVAEEHAEYEAVIRRSGGLTISEAETRVLEIAARCSKYKREYGRDSWQFEEQFAELKRIGSLYETLVARHPGLGRVLALAGSSSSRTGAGATVAARPTTRVVDRHSPEFLERERRQLTGGRSRVRRTRARGNRARSPARGRGSGRGRSRVNIDDLLNPNTIRDWFSFSRPSDPSSSS